MLTRLREITEQRCRDWRGTLVEFNGESDHIDIFMSLPPNLDPVPLRQQPQDDQFRADPS
jgi:REP element-mobilizing transposase RayT